MLGGASEGVEVIRGKVVSAELDAERRWRSGSRAPTAAPPTPAAPSSHRPRDPPCLPARAERRLQLFHCDSRREEFARLPEDRECDVGIVGGGESALSCVMFLRGFRPRARCTIYTPMLPLSRGESFLENRVFSDPDVVEWDSLDQTTRRDFVKHSDRGVFDPPSLGKIAYDDTVRFVLGRVNDVHAAPGDRVRLEYAAPEGAAGGEHEFVVNCTGFDLLAQMRELFAPALREEIETEIGQPLWERRARGGGADRTPHGAARDAAAAAGPGHGGAEPGTRVRQSRRPRAARQPRAAAVASRPQHWVRRISARQTENLYCSIEHDAKGRESGRLVALLVAAALALAACGGGSGGGGGGGGELTGSGYPGIDVVNSREVEGSSINRKTAPSLEVAWTLPLTAESTFGAYAGSPVVASGVIYSQDLESNVQAIDLESGEVLWTKKYEEIDQGPNGVVVQEGKVFGATNSAASPSTRRPASSCGRPKSSASHEGVDMAPGYHEGGLRLDGADQPERRYRRAASAPLGARREDRQEKWHFDTVPKSLGEAKVNWGGW